MYTTKRSALLIVLAVAMACVACAGLIGATAQAATPDTPLACVDGDQPSGARYRICMPNAFWNGDLVVYAHAYVKPGQPVAIPEDQLTIGGVSIADVVTAQGYAFAVSSYRRNGLAILEGIDDLVELVDIFRAEHGEPDRVILTGASEGGAVTVLGVERRPDVFDGGLALCGPYGDFQRQVDYFTDFRAVFDHFFPGLIEGTPISVTGNLTTTWETSFYSESVKPLLISTTYAITVNQVISVTGAAIDSSGFPTGTEPTFDRLLWYNILSTNDARDHLGGNPFDNQSRTYSGSTDDSALNSGIFRTTADPAARELISDSYQSSGALSVPLITMHTTGDEVVPYWHVATYQQKIDAAGSSAFYEHRRFDRFGHCNFTALEVQTAFAAISERVNARSFYLPAILLDATGP